MRFVGILLIMGHHLYILGFEGDYFFKDCWAWVDFYFILTGALTFRHFINMEVASDNYGSIALNYTFRKFKKFFVITTTSIALMVAITNISFHGNFSVVKLIKTLGNAIFEMLYLVSSGISGGLNAPLWFLSAMFIVMPIAVYFMLAHDEFWKILSLFLPIVYFGYKGVNTDRAWPNDMIRAFVCIALGTFTFFLGNQIKELVSESKKRKMFASIIELFCILGAVIISSVNVGGLNLLELLFVGIIALMLSQTTISANINSDFIRKLGELSMPMFVFHWCVGRLINPLIEDKLLKVFVYYTVTVLVGVVTIIMMRIAKRRLSDYES